MGHLQIRVAPNNLLYMWKNWSRHKTLRRNYQLARGKKQYGDWMREGWFSKGGQSKSRTTSSEDQAVADLGTGDVGNRAPSDISSVLESASLERNNITKANQALWNIPEASLVTNQTTLLLQATEN